MKKLLAVGTFALLVFAGSINRSQAAVVAQDDQLKFFNGPGSPGGIFHVHDTTQDIWFDTFCVELTQNVNFSDTFVVDGLSNVTINSGKMLNNYVAWLYTKFVDKTLPDFDFTLLTSNTPTANLQANILQYAVWNGVGWTDYNISYHGGIVYNPSMTSDPSYTPFVDWQAAYQADIASNMWDPTGYGDVKILNLGNLGDNHAANAQDQLVLVPMNPPGESPAPEPASIAIWGLLASLGGVVAWRRRAA